MVNPQRKTKMPGEGEPEVVETKRAPKRLFVAGDSGAAKPAVAMAKEAEDMSDVEKYGPESTLPPGTACNEHGERCKPGERATHRIGTIMTKRGLLVGRPVKVR